ncbi:MAG: Zn-dependent hydrolase [Pseudohongiellaceae bacterium]
MLEINFDRLKADVLAMGEIGKSEDQGIYRMAFSRGDMEGRAWFEQRIKEAGLTLYVDGAANIHARLNWDAGKASVMTGSHLDTVPGGGHLDGALGVLAGLECLRCLKEQGIQLARPVEAVSFTDEEGRFGEMIGSEAICGKLTPESIHDADNQEGISLDSAMEAIGLDARDVLQARRAPESIQAFVELHIEQGPVLDNAGRRLGIVDGIAGLFKWQVRLIGQADHAGTTPMTLRRDAFQGVVEVAGAIGHLLEEYGSSRSVATIGRVHLFPGAVNVVPGRAEFTLEVRDTDTHVLKNLAAAFRRTISEIAQRRDLMFEFSVIGELSPAHCDQGLVATVHRVCEEMQVEPLQMHSGAAHDTLTLCSITRAGMIMVPSVDGRSHSAAEWTAWEDIKLGGDVLLNTLRVLAST